MTTGMTFTEKDWDYYAECYDALNMLKPYRTLIQNVARLATTSPNGRILDAACGTGNLAHELLRRAAYLKAPRPEIYGIDGSPAMLNRAKQKCKDKALFLHCDLNEQICFPSRYFSVIVSVNTLYALRDPATTLKEFARLLSPGGRLILVTPKMGYQNGLVLKAHCKSTEPDAYWENMHETGEREAALIREACGNGKTAEMMITVGEINRQINTERSFHFFTREALEKLLRETPLSTQRVSSAYAKQGWLLVATK